MGPPLEKMPRHGAKGPRRAQAAVRGAQPGAGGTDVCAGRPSASASCLAPGRNRMRIRAGMASTDVPAKKMGQPTAVAITPEKAPKRRPPSDERLASAANCVAEYVRLLCAIR